MHFQNCFLKKINLISLIYSLSESSDSSEEEKSLKSSLICLITFSQCIYTLLETLADNNSQPFREQNSS